MYDAPMYGDGSAQHPEAEAGVTRTHIDGWMNSSMDEKERTDLLSGGVHISVLPFNQGLRRLHALLYKLRV